MKKLLSAMLLGLAARPALAAAPPIVPASLDALGLHLTLDADARQLVQAKVNSLCRHPASLTAQVALAEAAFPLIDQVLTQEGVPADFRYLALQESSLQGNAESIHGAVGYWQLKRETALGLGLTVDEQVDERRHLTASTRAAARYLARNNASLHNWASTLLSYNLGLSGVRPYVTPADANASSAALTARTSTYILTFLAQKLVFEVACAQHTVPFVPWREVPATLGLSLAEQATILAVAPADLARLNPWLLAPAVPQGQHPYTLLVPLTGPVVAAANPASLPPAPSRSTTQVRFGQVNGVKMLLAQPGDTPASLAALGGASLGFFLRINELSPGEALVPGEPYYFQRKKEMADEDYHVVGEGQTLAAIARHYGVLRHALRTYNRLGPDETVQPGLVLWLSHLRPRTSVPEYQSPPTTAPTAPPHPVLAAKPAPTPTATPEPEAPDEELASINDLPTEVPGPPVIDLPTRPVATDPVPTAPARSVVLTPVPVPAPRPAVTTVPRPAATIAPRPAVAGASYAVAAGETLYALARRLGVRPAELAAWNNLPPDAALRAGQLLQLSAPVTATSPASVTYVVAAGDTFSSLSRRYNCTVADLLARNNKQDAVLRVGEVLRVPRL